MRKQMVSVTVPANAVYFYVLGAEYEGRAVFKIGKAATVQAAALRRKEHEIKAGKMHLLAVVLAMDSDEKYCIARFKENCLDGTREWLLESPDLLAWIDFLRHQWFVGKDLESADALPFVDSKNWIPGGDNFQPSVIQQKLNFTGRPFDRFYDEDSVQGDYFAHPVMVDAARHAMGGIDLDPASCLAANQLVRAKHWFGVKDDGLAQNWHGRVWLDPPFDQWKKWAPKARAELARGCITDMCVYVSAKAITGKVFHDNIASIAAAVFTPRGRFRCHGPKATTSPTIGFCVLYLGSKVEKFYEAYQDHGIVSIPYPYHRAMLEAAEAVSLTSGPDILEYALRNRRVGVLA